MPQQRAPRAAAVVVGLPPLLLLLAQGAPRATRSTDPDKQPATRGQDAQRCAYALLPERVQLLGSPAGWMGLAHDGSLMTRDKATLLDWSLDLFSWAQPSVRMYSGSELLYKSEVVKEPSDLGGAWLDLWNGPRLRRVVALKDCDGVVMYVIRVRRGEAHEQAGDGILDHSLNCDYEIYNQDGEIIAMSTCNSDSDAADQMRFLDAQGSIITVAQSPVIEGGYIPFQLSDYYGPKVPWHVPVEGEKDTRHVPGFLQPWDIWFVDGEPGHPSNSSLLLAQNRWVVVAAIVDRALRDAWEEAGWSSYLAGYVYFAGVAARAGALALLGALLLRAFGMLHVLTFPQVHPSTMARHASVVAKPKKAPVAGGGGGAYGAFAAAPLSVVDGDSPVAVLDGQAFY